MNKILSLLVIIFALALMAVFVLAQAAGASEYGAIATGYLNGSAAAGVGFGNNQEDATQNAIDQCINQISTFWIECHVVSEFSCGGEGWVVTGTGHVEDGRASAAWGAGATPSEAVEMTRDKLKELYDVDWNINAPIGGGTDRCEGK